MRGRRGVQEKKRWKQGRRCVCVSARVCARVYECVHMGACTRVCREAGREGERRDEHTSHTNLEQQRKKEKVTQERTKK